ncbi:MAG: hypothetical protein QOI38_1672 [Sphingomonadales bacterium]|jgi:hypothetical protein|nr:hypothetical protein [Sphingomonadales bacterium]
MQLDPDGAQLFPGAFDSQNVAALRNLFSAQAESARLAAGPGLAPLLGPADAIARGLLGSAARAVRALFFDKNADSNWALGWHQDRTIAVRARRDVPGFSAWTVKSGMHHVVPPFEYLERMLVLRVHLDDAGADNAPLLVAPGSHRLGRIAEPEIAAAVARLGTAACLAEAGDVWACCAPVLHASDRAAAPVGRRVLQLAYSADTLPGGLEWLGLSC